jgi:DNA (cytosine-5)-methyltransferase 1
MRDYTAMDLFSGCGGLTLGLKQAGFRVIAAVEIDKLAANTYSRNHPSVSVWNKDVRGMRVKEMMRSLRIRPGQLDLLAGCPPCQGFSSIRTRNQKTTTDKRNSLIFEFLRFVRALRPKAIMMENVPGLAGYYRFEEFTDKLRAEGYEVESRILNAADYGVPQRRLRLILLGSRSGRIDFAAPNANRRTVQDAIRSMPVAGKSGDPLHDLKEKRSERILKRIKKIPKNGGSRSALGMGGQLKCHIACEGFRDVYGRMGWKDVAPTITSGCTNPSKGRFLHPTRDRAITLREAALLQGFPRNYFFPSDRGKEAVAEMIGNALPPEFIRRHARRIRSQLAVPFPG